MRIAVDYTGDSLHTSSFTDGRYSPSSQLSANLNSLIRTYTIVFMYSVLHGAHSQTADKVTAGKYQADKWGEGYQQDACHDLAIPQFERTEQ